MTFCSRTGFVRTDCRCDNCYVPPLTYSFTPPSFTPPRVKNENLLQLHKENENKRVAKSSLNTELKVDSIVVHPAIIDPQTKKPVKLSVGLVIL